MHMSVFCDPFNQLTLRLNPCGIVSEFGVIPYIFLLNENSKRILTGPPGGVNLNVTTRRHGHYNRRPGTACVATLSTLLGAAGRPFPLGRD